MRFQRVHAWMACELVTSVGIGLALTLSSRRQPVPARRASVG